jgi:hypothetical protein
MLGGNSPVLAGILEQGEVAGWVTGAFSDEGGRFQHCGILTLQYNRSLGITLQADAWALGAEDPGWSLQPGTRHRVNVAVDDLDWVEAQAEVTSAQLVTIQLPRSAALFDQMKSGRFLSLGLTTGLLNFGLRGAATALPALVACVKRHEPNAFPGASPTNPFRGTPGN